MGSELVDNSLSDLDSNSEGSERKSCSSSPFLHSETFEKMFPYYLSIGMSAKEYWDGESDLVKYYKEAEQMRLQRRNENAWLQGMYVYDAILRASPILHDFVKKGTKPEPYVDKPYPMTEDEIQKRQEEKERKVYLETIGRMQELMNKSRDKRKEVNQHV